MFRPLFCSLAALLCLAAGSQAQKKSAFDKATLEAYVRHMFVMDKQITVKIGEPKPSQFPGYQEVVVSASAGQAHQDFTFLVSQDGAKIIQGNFTTYDINQNPFKGDLDKMKTDGAPSMGTQGAPVVIVEFSDFECPYCKNEASVLRKNLLSAYPKEVHLYFKEFPLEGLHPWARAAAVASRCVYRQNADAFWAYHDWIFDKQSDITADNLKQKVLDWAKDTKGVDATQLGACMDAKSTDLEVTKDIADGRALKVDSTPTMFINGRRVAASLDWPTLRSIIDYEIEYQKTAKNAGEDCGCAVKLDIPTLTPSSPSPGTPLK
ncbi:MAG TPA: thioredoxin domain-containing protein [Bryobacteraceae bacterium]|nr:thioredoxin domain-containing protein [Bryobacteraceae bacterium]